MRPDQVLAASRYGVSIGGASAMRPVTGSAGPTLEGAMAVRGALGRPGAMLTGRCPRPLAATRHTTPLVGLPSDAALMRRTALMPGGEGLLPAG